MTRYITLAEYVWLAEQVTGLPAPVLSKAGRLDLADSALHAPAAGFGDDEFYPDLYDKAAVLTCRLAWNHPLSTVTSAPRGPACCCSSISTAVNGTPILPTSTRPKSPCWRWLGVRLMRRGSPAGFETGSRSLEASQGERGQARRSSS